MIEYDVRSVGAALAYITDCNLATVCDMACKRSRSKREFRRQVSIAQKAIDWMREFGVDFSATRAADVVEKFNGSVSDWAEPWLQF